MLGALYCLWSVPGQGQVYLDFDQAVYHVIVQRNRLRPFRACFKLARCIVRVHGVGYLPFEDGHHKSRYSLTFVAIETTQPIGGHQLEHS